MLPLISVVVPVYNVESYLRKCLDSIIGQTYDNLQIILVDDGSTDSSGAICDECAQKDERVIVMHIRNSGLSGARNTGIGKASGDYVVFVDSDDYIGLNHIKNLHEAIKTYPNAKMAITGLIDFNDEATSQLPTFSTYRTIELLSSSEVLKITVSPKTKKPFGEHACGKLFHKDLLPYLNFPPDRHYEDRYVFYKTMHAAGVAAYEDANDYFYFRKRADSITNVLSEKSFDCIDATRLMIPFFQEHEPEVLDDVRRRYAGELINGFYLACRLGSDTKADEFFAEMKSIRPKVLSDQSVLPSTKLGYLISYLGKKPLLAAARINQRLFLEK